MTALNGTVTTVQDAEAIIRESLQHDAYVFMNAFVQLCNEHKAHLIATPHFDNDGRVVAVISHLSIRGNILDIKWD